MVMTDSILRALALDYNDYPEEILESCGIDFEGWSEDEIYNKSEDILDQYTIVDDVVIEYEGQQYAVDYLSSPYYGLEILSEPFKVEKTTRTITVTEYKRCN